MAFRVFSPRLASIWPGEACARSSSTWILTSKARDDWEAPRDHSASFTASIVSWRWAADFFAAATPGLLIRSNMAITVRAKRKSDGGIDGSPEHSGWQR